MPEPQTKALELMTDDELLARHVEVHATFGVLPVARARAVLVREHEKVVAEMTRRDMPHEGRSLLDNLSLETSRSRVKRFMRTLGGLIPESPGPEDEVRIVLTGTASGAMESDAPSFGLLVTAPGVVLFVDPGRDAQLQGESLLEGGLSKVTHVLSTCPDDPLSVVGLQAVHDATGGVELMTLASDGSVPGAGVFMETKDLTVEGFIVGHGIRKAVALVLRCFGQKVVVAPRASSAKEVYDYCSDPDLALVGGGSPTGSMEFMDRKDLNHMLVRRTHIVCYRDPRRDVPAWGVVGMKRGVRADVQGATWIVTAKGIEYVPGGDPVNPRATPRK